MQAEKAAAKTRGLAKTSLSAAWSGFGFRRSTHNVRRLHRRALAALRHSATCLGAARHPILRARAQILARVGELLRPCWSGQGLQHVVAELLYINRQPARIPMGEAVGHQMSGDVEGWQSNRRRAGHQLWRPKVGSDETEQPAISLYATGVNWTIGDCRHPQAPGQNTRCKTTSAEVCIARGVFSSDRAKCVPI